MRRLAVIFLLLCGLLAAACKEDRIVQVPDSLKAVYILGSSLVLEPGAGGEFVFKVVDAGFEFNYDVASPGCQVLLRRHDGGGPPLHFTLTKVSKGTEPGYYVAQVTDNGSAETYLETVCVAIVQRGAAESFVSSAYFSVESMAVEFGPSVDTGLPIVYIDTQNGKSVNSKTVDVPAVLKVKGERGYSDQRPASCTIRGRGNTTWSWPKKPYLVKMDERQQMLGMPAHRRWVLLANFMDRTLMRNLVAMKVSSLTGLPYTPRCVPVELILNGKHLGSYLLIEQIRIDANRLALPEEDGTWLFELDFHYDNDTQWIDPHGSCHGTGSGIPFALKYPYDDAKRKAQKQAAQKYINEVASVVYGSSFANPSNGYQSLLDVDTFIDYWIVFEVMGNHELMNPGSVYFYKAKGGLLSAGPCWDFDWGGLSYNTSPQAKTGLLNRNAIWYAQLFKDPAFVARVRARFEELLPALQTIPAYIDACEKLLSASAEINFSMWNPADDRTQNGGRIINGDENLDFHAAVARLRSIYEERLRVIKANL